jgi:hypothetical protein
MALALVVVPDRFTKQLPLIGLQKVVVIHGLFIHPTPSFPKNRGHSQALVNLTRPRLSAARTVRNANASRRCESWRRGRTDRRRHERATGQQNHSENAVTCRTALLPTIRSWQSLG